MHFFAGARGAGDPAGWTRVSLPTARMRSGVARSTEQGGPLGHSGLKANPVEMPPVQKKYAGKVKAEGKQANSAIGNCVSVQLITNGQKITAFVPKVSWMNFIKKITWFQLLDLVAKIRLSVTFLEFASRSSKEPMSLFWPHAKARRKDQDPKL